MIKFGFSTAGIISQEVCFIYLYIFLIVFDMAIILEPLTHPVTVGICSSNWRMVMGEPFFALAKMLAAVQVK